MKDICENNYVYTPCYTLKSVNRKCYRNDVERDRNFPGLCHMMVGGIEASGQMVGDIFIGSIAIGALILGTRNKDLAGSLKS